MEDLSVSFNNARRYKYVKSKIINQYFLVEEPVEPPTIANNNNNESGGIDNNFSHLKMENVRLLNEIALQQQHLQQQQHLKQHQEYQKQLDQMLQQKILLKNIQMIDKLVSAQPNQQHALRTQKYHSLWSLPAASKVQPAVTTAPQQRKSLADINVDLVPEFYPRSYTPPLILDNMAQKPPMMTQYANKPSSYYNTGGGGVLPPVGYPPQKMSPDSLSSSITSNHSTQSTSSSTPSVARGDIFDQMDKFPYGFMQQPLKQNKFYDSRMFCPFCKKNKEPFAQFTSHTIKTCVILQNCICENCGQRGHTMSHCKLNMAKHSALSLINKFNALGEF